MLLGGTEMLVSEKAKKEIIYGGINKCIEVRNEINSIISKLLEEGSEKKLELILAFSKGVSKSG